ncbi:hypothetical protein JRQ81_016715, partial [Phrynocephalus forsythii]
ARLNCFPSAQLKGRFNNTPYGERVCPSGNEVPENLSHTILECRLYGSEHLYYLHPITSKYTGMPSTDLLKFLLSGANQTTTQSVAKFLFAALRIRKSYH